MKARNYWLIRSVTERDWAPLCELMFPLSSFNGPMARDEDEAAEFVEPTPWAGPFCHARQGPGRPVGAVRSNSGATVGSRALNLGRRV